MTLVNVVMAVSKTLKTKVKNKDVGLDQAIINAYYTPNSIDLDENPHADAALYSKSINNEVILERIVTAETFFAEAPAEAAKYKKGANADYFTVLGVFNYTDGLPTGLTRSFDENGNEIITGTIVYPAPKTKGVPDGLLYAQDKSEAQTFIQWFTDPERTAQEKATCDPIHRIVDQPLRRWDLL